MKLIPSIKTQFSDWYNTVVEEAKLADHSAVKGCMTILPYGYALWENMQKELDKRIKKMGVKNMAFPLLIPYHLLAKEKEHIEGFSPEVALVTHAGGEKLDEPLVIRPTSEVIIHSYFKKWLRSWRDLPIKVNQWCSVLRWEKRPRLFLRTTEFWWQEGHTMHSNKEEAKMQVFSAISLYRDFCHEFLSIPVIMARKPDYERFAGAEETWTIEGMMQDGKAVQMGTSHLLSESFVHALDISFQDEKKEISLPVLTSWGVTTRLIGTLIMVHGDQRGIIFPPRIAPIQIVLIPIFKKSDSEISLVLEAIQHCYSQLSLLGFSCEIDDRDLSPGSKFYEQELRGVPFRIEIGAREVSLSQFTLFFRDTHERRNFPFALFSDSQELRLFFDSEVSNFHNRLYKKANDFQGSRIFYSSSLAEFGPRLNSENGFCVTHWCGVDERRFKEYQSSVRCVLEDDQFFQEATPAICCLHDSVCGRDLKKILVARSY